MKQRNFFSKFLSKKLKKKKLRRKNRLKLIKKLKLKRKKYSIKKKYTFNKKFFLFEDRFIKIKNKLNTHLKKIYFKNIKKIH